MPRKIIGTTDKERLECQNCGDTDILLVADVCHADECNGVVFSKNLCKKHYQKAWRILQKKQKERRESEFWQQVDAATRERWQVA